ncbi:MAG: hypothetical protein AB1656_24195 [Candidatus Omnitrophota bacterium]
MFDSTLSSCFAGLLSHANAAVGSGERNAYRLARLFYDGNAVSHAYARFYADGMADSAYSLADLESFPANQQNDRNG